MYFQPAHSCSLISNFIIRFLYNKIHILAKSKVSRLQLASVAEQARLSLTWSYINRDMFSRDIAHLKPCLSVPIHLQNKCFEHAGMIPTVLVKHIRPIDLFVRFTYERTIDAKKAFSTNRSKAVILMLFDFAWFCSDIPQSLSSRTICNYI